MCGCLSFRRRWQGGFHGLVVPQRPGSQPAFRLELAVLLERQECASVPVEVLAVDVAAGNAGPPEFGLELAYPASWAAVQYPGMRVA